jgi:hypothetical protein
MIGKMGMSDKGVPNSKEASNLSLPDDMMFGRAHTRVDFDMVNKDCGHFFNHHNYLMTECIICNQVNLLD